MINYEQAYKLMEEMIQNSNLRKHGIAVEVIMRDLCKFLKEKHPEQSEEEFNEDEWAIVGLLHDADYEAVEKDPARHTLVTEEKLRPLGVSERIIDGIKAHHDGIKNSRDNFLEKGVYAADDISGLITAVALVKDKKLSNVTVESVMKKFNQPNFAAGAKREQIKKGCEELGLNLEEFVTIALGAMQKASEKLGL